MAIQKPPGYDEAEIRIGGEFEQLPPGAYKCVIKRAEEVTSKTGKQMLVLELDIAEGEYEGYFERTYNDRNKQFGTATWQGIYRQLTEGTSLPYFKGMINEIEQSNKPYKFDWDEKSLTGKRIGGVFRREQFMGQDGTPKFAIRCQFLCDISRVSEKARPADKLLDNSVPPAPTYSTSYESAPKFEEIGNDDDLPF